jgi:hypothetical protein
MMDRHRTDFVELLFGLLFVAAGAGFVVHQTTDTSFDAAWIAAIALVTVGVAFLAVTLFNRPRSAPIAAASAPSSPTWNDTIPNDTIPNDPIPNDPIPNDPIPNDAGPDNAFVDDDTPVPPPAADAES